MAPFPAVHTTLNRRVRIHAVFAKQLALDDDSGDEPFSQVGVLTAAAARGYRETRSEPFSQIHPSTQ